MIISLSDFNNLSDKDKTKTFAELKQSVGVSGIIKEWNISRSKVYSMMREFNIPVHKKTNRSLKTKKEDGSKSMIENTNLKVNKKNVAPASKPKRERRGKVGSEASSQSTLVVSKTEDSKFHLYVETQGSASMINDTLSMILESGRLTEANLQVNLTLQEM